MDPIPRLRSVIMHAHEHIAFSRYSSLWFFVVIVHCIIQVSFQAVTFVDNSSAQHVVDVCLQEAGIPKSFVIIMGNSLQQCDGIPTMASTTCKVISPVTTDLVIDLDPDQSNTLNLTLPNGTSMTTTPQCVNSLSWLDEMFRDSKTEDVITLCFQLWLLVVSLLAILHDSIPHLAVCVASHVLDTAWAMFRIKYIMNLRAQYFTYIVEGACNGADILGNWWDLSLSHAIPTAIFNSVVLAVILFLSWKLFWTFMRQAFSRVWASPVISHAYKLVLFFEAEMEISAFFAFATTVIWVDRISNGAIIREVVSFQTLFIFTAVILPLWALSGWISIRKEIRWMFLCFGLLQLFVLAVWLASFSSALYRYEIVTSAFFSCMSVTTFVFIVFTGMTGLICRLNFGKGLAHFLKVQAVLNSTGFTPGYFADDPSTGAETEIDFNLTNPEKVGKSELYREDSVRKAPDYGLIRGPSHNLRSALKRLNCAARNAIHPNEGDRVDFAPFRFCEPEFKLPIQSPPAVLLSARKPTESMFSQSSVESAGVVSYALRSPLPNATAHTVKISQAPKTVYLAPVSVILPSYTQSEEL